VEPKALAKAASYLAVGEPLLHLADGAEIMKVNSGKLAELYPAFGMQTKIPKDRDVVSILLNANSLSGGSNKNPLKDDTIKNQYPHVTAQIKNFVAALKKGCALPSLEAELCYFPCTARAEESKFLVLLFCDPREEGKLFNTVLPELQGLGELSQTSRGPGTSR
jgi:hypothetical protein